MHNQQGDARTAGSVCCVCPRTTPASSSFSILCSQTHLGPMNLLQSSSVQFCAPRTILIGLSFTFLNVQIRKHQSASRCGFSAPGYPAVVPFKIHISAISHYSIVMACRFFCLLSLSHACCSLCASYPFHHAHHSVLLFGSITIGHSIPIQSTHKLVRLSIPHLRAFPFYT